MSYTKNYYHILGLVTPGPGLSPSPPPAQPKSSELRRAYRNALLAAHPDKKGATAAAAATAAGSSATQREPAPLHTVDDVREAFRVLDDARTRTEYDGWVVRSAVALQTSGGKDSPGQPLSADFLLGLDALDLSDFLETERQGGGGVEWVRACRCGEMKGFCILEVDLEEAERRGEGEVLVGCGGCSLWVRVGFEVEEG